MVAPSPANLQLRKWILDKLDGSTEFETALESAIVDALGTVLTTRGDLLTRDGTGAVRLAKGAQNTIFGMGANDPAWSTLSAAIDSAIGSTQGAILYRSSTAWTKLDPGTSGDVFTSNGAGADPSYAAIPSPAYQAVSGSPFTITSDLTVTGLASYTSLYVVGRGVTCTLFQDRRMQVSINNGSNWITSYTLVNSTGGETSVSSLLASNSTVSTAVGFIVEIPNWNAEAAGKIIRATGAGIYYTTTTSAFNALKLFASGGSLNGGTVDIFGIPA